MKTTKRKTVSLVATLILVFVAAATTALAQAPKDPTRTLAEWQQIVSKWEEHLLRGGPAPKISTPPKFREREGMVNPTKGKGKDKKVE